MSRSADLAYLSTLARLEVLRLRAFWRYATRDIVFDICVVAGVAMLYGTARRGFDLASGAPEAVQLALSFGLGLLLLLSAYAGPGSRARERLLAGPFHSLVGDPRRMALWMSLRALGYALFACLGAAVLIATMQPPAAAAFLGLSAAGAATGAALTSLRRERKEPRGEDEVGRTRARRLRVRSPAVLIALGALRRGRPPAGLLALAVVLVGGLAARLATHNNNAPEIGATLSALAGLAAGALLLPRGRLPGVLGRESPRMITLFLWLNGGPLAAALAGGATAAAICGLGAVQAAQSALSSLVGLAVVAWFFFLHRLMRSQRYAAVSTSLEFAAALFMAVVEASLAPFWLAVRGVILVRGAARRRWLDR